MKSMDPTPLVGIGSPPMIQRMTTSRSQHYMEWNADSLPSPSLHVIKHQPHTTVYLVYYCTNIYGLKATYLISDYTQHPNWL